MTKGEMNAALATWPNLQASLSEASEEDCRKMLVMEREGKQRLQFLLRIYGRFNRLRAERERRELVTGMDSKLEDWSEAR